MRCLACDRNLSDYESTRKFESGNFVDLCNHCYFSGVQEQIKAYEREDLRGSVSTDDTEITKEELMEWD